ncbi:MAG: hypothetical protein AAB267_02465 [Candidatus Desantisbacteria bacterium]
MEIHYTPKHGKRVEYGRNRIGGFEQTMFVAKIENITEMKREVASWESDRNKRESKVNWRFTTPDARIS